MSSVAHAARNCCELDFTSAQSNRCVGNSLRSTVPLENAFGLDWAGASVLRRLVYTSFEHERKWKWNACQQKLLRANEATQSTQARAIGGKIHRMCSCAEHARRQRGMEWVRRCIRLDSLRINKELSGLQYRFTTQTHTCQPMARRPWRRIFNNSPRKINPTR